FHGHRLNNDQLHRHGAGYVASHGDDIFFAGSEWFRGIDLITGPDGSVYVADWSDIGECHENDGVHRTSGRIYRLTYDETPSALANDLAVARNMELVALQSHENAWYPRQTRRILQERAAAGDSMAD